MAATTSAAVKAHIETLGLAVGVVRDRLPKPASYPIIVVTDGVSRLPEPDGDTGDPNADKGIRELVTVDVWQQRVNPDGTAAESPTLLDALHRGLHGTRLRTTGTGAPPTVVYGALVTSSVRVPDPDANVVHDAVTLLVRRGSKRP